MSEAGAREAPRTWGPAAAAGAPLAGLAMEPAALNSAIEARVRRMYDGGLLDEVRRLLDAGGLSQTALQAIGYAEAADALAGQCTVAVAQERTIARTRRLAKRQRTWFRRQASVAWIEAGGAEAVAETARRVVEHWTRHGPREIAG
jgi:tRNA dimethylallyltransferase